IQRDTIQTAKLVASLDQVSGGRFLFGIGGGWNQEEIENHGTVFGTRMKKMREQIEAMKAIWTETKPEYHGELVEFDTLILRSGWGDFCACGGRPRFRRLIEPHCQRDPTAFRVDLQYFDTDDIARLRNFAWVLDVSIGHRGDVHQTVLVDPTS